MNKNCFPYFLSMIYSSIPLKCGKVSSIHSICFPRRWWECPHSSVNTTYPSNMLCLSSESPFSFATSAVLVSFSVPSIQSAGSCHKNMLIFTYTPILSLPKSLGVSLAWKTSPSFSLFKPSRTHNLFLVKLVLVKISQEGKVLVKNKLSCYHKVINNTETKIIQFISLSYNIHR